MFIVILASHHLALFSLRIFFLSHDALHASAMYAYRHLVRHIVINVNSLLLNGSSCFAYLCLGFTVILP